MHGAPIAVRRGRRWRPVPALDVLNYGVLTGLGLTGLGLTCLGLTCLGLTCCPLNRCALNRRVVSRPVLIRGFASSLLLVFLRAGGVDDAAIGSGVDVPQRLSGAEICG